MEGWADGEVYETKAFRTKGPTHGRMVRWRTLRDKSIWDKGIDCWTDGELELAALQDGWTDGQREKSMGEEEGKLKTPFSVNSTRTHRRRRRAFRAFN